MTAKRIDEAKLARMWAAGLPTPDIAAEFGVLYPAINRAAHRLGLASRTDKVLRGARHQKPPAEPEPVKAPPAGGYARVAEIARCEGVSLRQALQIFHRSRA